VIKIVLGGKKSSSKTSVSLSSQKSFHPLLSRQKVPLAVSVFSLKREEKTFSPFKIPLR